MSLEDFILRLQAKAVGEPAQQVRQRRAIGEADDREPSRTQNGLNIGDNSARIARMLDDFGTEDEVERTLRIETLGVLQLEFHHAVGRPAPERGVGFSDHCVHDVDPQNVAKAVLGQHVAVHPSVTPDIECRIERGNRLPRNPLPQQEREQIQPTPVEHLRTDVVTVFVELVQLLLQGLSVVAGKVDPVLQRPLLAATNASRTLCRNRAIGGRATY